MMTDTALEHLARLREEGAHRHDPVRFRYLESLARRLHESPCPPSNEAVKKLNQGLAGYQASFIQAQKESQVLLDTLVEDNIHDLDLAPLRHLFDSGDLKSFQRSARAYQQHRRAGSPLLGLIQALQAGDTIAAEEDVTPLDALLRKQPNLFQHTTTQKGDRPSTPPLHPQRELKALRHLRATRARLHTQRRIDHAIDQTPGDAGPLNAHRLVTRSLETLRDLSPDYLNRFVSYMDTLLALEKVTKKG